MRITHPPIFWRLSRTPSLRLFLSGAHLWLKKIFLFCQGGAAEIALSIIPVIESAGGKVLVRANVTGQSVHWPSQCLTSRTHCKEDPIYVFPEMKLCGRVPDFHIHVSVSDLYIPTIGPPIYCCKENDRSWEYSVLTETWRRKSGTRPRSFISGNMCFELLVQFFCSAWGTGKGFTYC